MINKDQKMGKILKILQEHDNAKQIAAVYPYSIYYDMVYHFARQPLFDTKNNIFATTLFHQPFVEEACDRERYSFSNPQGKVLMHGIIYKALFNIYMEYVKKSFDSVLLADIQKQYNKDKIIIDFISYNDLPKKYRGIFVPYDNDNYILNVPYNKMNIAYNKKNKTRLEYLLKRAKMLIPVIYREPSPDLDLGGTFKVYTNPCYVPDSKAAQKVSNEQLYTIHELHDIFVEISKITLPLQNVPHTGKNAYKILNEYITEQNQQDTVYKMQTGLNEYKSMLKEPLVPVKIINGKEVIKAKDFKRVLNRQRTPENTFFTRGQRYRFARQAFLTKLHKDLKTYSR